MVFVETPIFTRSLLDLLSDDEYRDLQRAMICNPEVGATIRGSGGIRKLRWSRRGTGKRGGARIIYFWHATTETAYMLFAYPKNEQEDLTAQQLRILARLVREEFE